MIFFTGFGLLSFFGPGLLGALVSALMDNSTQGFIIGAIAGSVLMAGLGYYLNRIRPKQQFDQHMAERRHMVQNNVATGRFRLGPEHPVPHSRQEAEAQAQWFLQEEEARTKKALFGRHTLLWIPMDYASIGITVLLIIGAIVELT